MNIPIKKHTKVRRPMSDWQIFLDPPAYGSKYPVSPVVVQDIRKLENPLYCISIADQMIEKMNNALCESEDRAWLAMPQKNLEMLQSHEPKSLWQKLTNKLRRK